MKYYKTSLNEYVEKVLSINIHENNIQLKRLHELNTIENTIFYGPSGIGKYSQVLYLLSKKNVNLKHQQKLYIQKDNNDKFIYIMSDIYFEIDMELLGCSSKTLWHEIFLQILDIVMINKKQFGIIVCKNFHSIHSELLDIFYSYLQNNKYKNVKIKYILITEQISFIPDNLLNNFIVVNLFKSNINIDNKDDDIYNKKINENITLKKICNNIIQQIKESNLIITEFRETLYQILIYGLNINECLFYILSYFYKKKIFDNNLHSINKIMESIYEFLKKFNNNYRPITHLESIFILFILYYENYLYSNKLIK